MDISSRVLWPRRGWVEAKVKTNVKYLKDNPFMMPRFAKLLLLLALAPNVSRAEESVSEKKTGLPDLCVKELTAFPGKADVAKLNKACSEVKQLETCTSHEGIPIFHFDRQGEGGKNKKAQKILVLSLIHGDETPSGSVSRLWMERLSEIMPRNDWRVVPILNPDGVKLKTRTNAKGVDVNRNFPTQDWDPLALKSWKDLTGSNPRRYPGPQSASEPETLCTLAHIKDFSPDFIISIHTPIGVLDFDGPQKLNFPSFKPLPWQSLGNFPGSLGRYMWKEHGVPVLTVELKGNALAQKQLEAFDKLQDITGTVALQSQKVLEKTGIEKKEIKLEQTATPSTGKSEGGRADLDRQETAPL